MLKLSLSYNHNNIRLQKILTNQSDFRSSVKIKMKTISRDAFDGRVKRNFTQTAIVSAFNGIIVNGGRGTLFEKRLKLDCV